VQNIGAEGLGPSPYSHNGSKLQLSDVVQFYINSSQLARQGLLRNPPPEFQNILLSDDDLNASSRLISLTEDYDGMSADSTWAVTFASGDETPFSGSNPKISESASPHSGHAPRQCGV